MSTSTPAAEPSSTSVAPSETKPIASKRKQRPFSNKRKQPPFTKDSGISEPPAKRATASFEKKPNQPAFLTFLLRTFFTISVSNHGVQPMVTNVYSVLKGRDYKLTQTLTEHKLQYVTLLCFINRMVQIGILTSTAIVDNASRLNSVCKGILLPDILAKFIESIGSVKMLNGATVVPFIDDFDEMCKHESIFIDPGYWLTINDIQPHGDWSIHKPWILEYQDTVSRALRHDMNFRKVDFSSPEGREEMLASYRLQSDGELSPLAPQMMNEHSTRLGAAYGFRNEGERDGWVGSGNALLFPLAGTSSIDPRFFIKDLALESMRVKPLTRT